MSECVAGSSRCLYERVKRKTELGREREIIVYYETSQRIVMLGRTAVARSGSWGTGRKRFGTEENG